MQIVDQQIELNFLQEIVDEKIRKLNEFLKDINAASDCMRKKEYYLQLKKHAPSGKYNEDRINMAKEKMLKGLGKLEVKGKLDELNELNKLTELQL